MSATASFAASSQSVLLTKIPAMPILTDFIDRVIACERPGDILDTLDALASSYLPLSVLGASRISLKVSDWRSRQLGKDVLLHSSAPNGWWDEYAAMANTEQDAGAMLARSSLMGCTWTETMQMLDSIGIDRWPYEMSLRYGIRDVFICSVGRRWLVCYWSSKVLSNVLSQPLRIVLFAAASFAALRLQQLVGPEPGSTEPRTAVTPRELAVLRLVSTGKRSEDVGKLLGIGAETVRSHLKKVQTKLGVHNRTHAVAEAIRQQLIP